MLIGESFQGEGVDAAHVNTVLGPRTGPVGTAWATALATPSQGHAPFVVCLRPGTAVKPFTLFVTKSAPQSETHQRLTWGAAQAGVAAGVADAVAEGVLAPEQCDDDVVIAAVWVNPAAGDADAVFHANRAATLEALRDSVHRLPTADQVAQARLGVSNGFYPGPGVS
ncbi:formaldehyde-activating enzyme [Modestobacter sp. Leaf380]|uniref:formaldehyde-activating enzyme n=1 Tax=Modestobacter sp. Leaf380 TaxID=1736356 RepID=UPI0006F41E8A|nr:formaldehyde-activating enzyme [Modestobacter sp. Leaf380]KQS68217.1 aldehyde-activating protein [Modestobacter sp. Leaf380]